MFVKWQLYQAAELPFASTNGNGQRRALTAEVIFGASLSEAIEVTKLANVTL